MFSEIHVYFEGDRRLKEGFSRFFGQLRQAARQRRCKFQPIPCGPQSEACKDFATAIRANTQVWNILLLDSDGPDTQQLSESLCRQQGWDERHKESIFWMVQMMESWFHADKEALEEFYGSCFRRNALRPNPRVEEIPKADLERSLKDATKECPQHYLDHKASHGSELLRRIRPDKVRNAAPNCNMLFDAVLSKLADNGAG